MVIKNAANEGSEADMFLQTRGMAWDIVTESFAELASDKHGYVAKDISKLPDLKMLSGFLLCILKR